MTMRWRRRWPGPAPTCGCVTSRFAYGAAPAPDGYRIDEHFYRHVRGAAGSRLRTVAKAAEHLPDTLRYRAVAADVDIVHFQWLTVPWLDLRLLPESPVVLTIHDPMARGLLDRLAAPAHLLRALPAVVVHTEAARRAVVAQGLDPTPRARDPARRLHPSGAAARPGPPCRMGWQGDRHNRSLSISG